MDEQLFFFITIFAVLFIVLVLNKNRRNLNSIFPVPSAYKFNNTAQGEMELTQKLINYYDKILKKYVHYYTQIGRDDRRKFIVRLHAFISKMDFQGREGQEINLKVCILSSAPAIQLSLGLDNYMFNHFHTIVIYPNQFYSKAQNDYVKGGVSNGDAIFFSWTDLEKGFRHHDDGVNLGLHEMAHAIHMEYFDDDFERNFPNWESVALKEVSEILKHPSPIIRNYALHNRHELFAVCCEVFFERPQKLKKQSFMLYNSMVELFNQDPCNLAH